LEHYVSKLTSTCDRAVLSTLASEAVRDWATDLQLGGEALLVVLAEEDNDVVDGRIGGLSDLVGRLAKTGGE
jgi:hypothetical protein